MRKSFDLKTQNIVFGSAGRDNPAKNLDGLICSFSMIAKKLPTAMLLLAGRGVDAQNPKLTHEINRLDLNDRVMLLGERSDIPDFMNAIDIYVSASNAESFPLALGEAMATETVCVSTNVGACEYIIGDTGELVSPGDLEQLAEALYKIAVMDEVMLNSLARRARKRIVDNFSIEQAAQRYLSLCVGIVRCGND